MSTDCKQHENGIYMGGEKKVFCDYNAHHKCYTTIEVYIYLLYVYTQQ